MEFYLRRRAGGSFSRVLGSARAKLRRLKSGSQAHRYDVALIDRHPNTTSSPIPVARRAHDDRIQPRSLPSGLKEKNRRPTCDQLEGCHWPNGVDEGAAGGDQNSLRRRGGSCRINNGDAKTISEVSSADFTASETATPYACCHCSCQGKQTHIRFVPCFPNDSRTGLTLEAYQDTPQRVLKVTRAA